MAVVVTTGAIRPMHSSIQNVTTNKLTRSCFTGRMPSCYPSNSIMPAEPKCQ